MTCLATKRVTLVGTTNKIASVSVKASFYTNTDVVGVETGAAFKNVIAIGAGILHGLGYGDDAKAALMTRGLAEVARLGMAYGAM